MHLLQSIIYIQCKFTLIKKSKYVQREVLSVG